MSAFIRAALVAWRTSFVRSGEHPICFIIRATVPWATLYFSPNSRVVNWPVR